MPEVLCREITDVCSQLSALFTPAEVYVFSIKRKGQTQEVCDFDVCLVTEFDEGELSSMIRRAYETVDSDVAFDLIFYTPEQFDKFSREPSSFVSRILRQGIKYEQR